MRKRLFIAIAIMAAVVLSTAESVKAGEFAIGQKVAEKVLSLIAGQAAESFFGGSGLTVDELNAALDAHFAKLQSDKIRDDITALKKQINQLPLSSTVEGRRALLTDILSRTSDLQTAIEHHTSGANFEMVVPTFVSVTNIRMAYQVEYVVNEAAGGGTNNRDALVTSLVREADYGISMMERFFKTYYHFPGSPDCVIVTQKDIQMVLSMKVMQDPRHRNLNNCFYFGSPTKDIFQRGLYNLGRGFYYVKKADVAGPIGALEGPFDSAAAAHKQRIPEAMNTYSEILGNPRASIMQWARIVKTHGGQMSYIGGGTYLTHSRDMVDAMGL